MMFSSDQPSNAGDGALEVSQPLVVQNFPIVLVSIMSAFYQNPETLKYMMEWMRDQHHSDIPIVYLCGDTVYRNTQHCLFPSGGRDPIEKGCQSWEKKYGDIIDEFSSQGKLIREFDAYWDTVKSSGVYAGIKKFTDLVFSLDPTIEKLQAQFSSLQNSSSNQQLLDRIESLNLARIVEDISTEFREKNLKRLNKQEKKKKGETKKTDENDHWLLDRLSQLGVVENNHEFLQVENKNDESLLDATRRYLAEEYAVFITLSSAADIAGISAICGLDFSFSKREAAVRPALYYPIAATKGSDLIFDLFEKIRNIYVEYSVLLSLPNIPQSSVVVDLIIPENMFPSAHVRSSEVLESKKTSGLLESNHTVSLTKVASSVFYCPSVNDFEVKETAEKIIRMIDSHCESVDRGVHKSTKLKYRNGVECHIEVEKSLNLPAITPVDSSLLDIQREDVKKTIQEAIYSVKSGGLEEIDKFITCLGYKIKLHMRFTPPSLAYPSSVSHFLNA